MRFSISFCLSLVQGFPFDFINGYAGIIRGRVTDAQGAPLAFANVAVRTTATSTAANEQGDYQLKLPPGRYELVFQYVGYKPRIRSRAA